MFLTSSNNSVNVCAPMKTLWKESGCETQSIPYVMIQKHLNKSFSSHRRDTKQSHRNNKHKDLTLTIQDQRLVNKCLSII